jgi:predicted polyphosphate/ATP-dependent NAD kinase
MFKLGLVVNPLAGVGGPLGLKGSDHLSPEDQIYTGLSRSAQRARRCLKSINENCQQPITVYGFDGMMSAQCEDAPDDFYRSAGLDFVSLGSPKTRPSSPEDTLLAVRALEQLGVNLLLFVGGDGTARDIFSAVADRIPVLGIPAGVKMHSGVYAVSPESAADIIMALVNGKLVDITEAEVRDIDEEAFRQGQVRSQHFGELLVPRVGGFLQQVKSAGREVEELVLVDIADDLSEQFEPNTLYLIGPGSTTAGIMSHWELSNTLLGFDIVRNSEVLAGDVSAEAISEFLHAHQGPVKVVLTAIGGQGHILGRGNQQLTPELIRQIGRDNFLIVATKTKIMALAGRPLLVDSNDPELDQQWQGYIKVITGYRDAVMYRVSASGE